MPLFWLIAGFVMLMLAALRAWIIRHRQSRRLRELAHSRRFNFTPEDLIGVHERFHNLRLIRQGHRRRAWNLLYGTTDVGLVTLFCYRYDLGFGIRQIHRQCWLAVIETPHDHACWHASSSAVGSAPDGCHTTELADFTIHTDACDTIDQLRHTDLETMLQNTISVDRLEIHHGLVAAATPYSRDIETPMHLLDTVIQLTRLLPPRKEN